LGRSPACLECDSRFLAKLQALEISFSARLCWQLFTPNDQELHAVASALARCASDILSTMRGFCNSTVHSGY